MTTTIRAIVRRARRFLGRALSGEREAERFVRSYSQEGEDRILARLFEDRMSQPGFYVDVGAHHPTRFSNTQLFYELGWRGVNIDAAPGSMQAFRRERPRDINLEVAIDATPGTRELSVFTEGALNTLSPEIAASRSSAPGVATAGSVSVKCRRLDAVLSDVLDPGQVIDFLSVDVEGLDHEVVLSNDWRRFRPRIVLVECLGTADLGGVERAPVAISLGAMGYTPIAKTVNTVIFKDAAAAQGA